MRRIFIAALALCAAPFVAEAAPVHHVLLISIDGLHNVDLQNYVSSHPGSTMAALSKHGTTYTNASTAIPSDSFPGMLALATGGSPVSHGVFYDDTYDATLYPPGSNCAGTPGTEVTNFEALDWDLTQLDGGNGVGADPRNPHINPAYLAQSLSEDGVCSLEWPHKYLKNGVNTVFEVAHQSGMRTAWSDKHPAYEILNGPSGRGLDDFFAPEINSTSLNANGFPDAPAGADWTFDPFYTRAYDQFKVNVVLNWIKGLDQTGAKQVGTPAIFGMNFQAVSVAQKVTKADLSLGTNNASNVVRGGYVDAAGHPTAPLAASLDYVDGAVGQFVAAMKKRGLYENTLVIIAAKHGQSPIDLTKLHMLTGSANAYATADVVDPVDVLSVSGINVAWETADDVSLLWLANHSDAPAAATALLADVASGNSTHIKHLYSGSELITKFGNPAFGRTPDLIVESFPGVIYSGSKKKLAEHGGFSVDDTNAALLLSNPSMAKNVVTSAVKNAQVAPTILKALGLDPSKLVAVRKEGTQVLPASF